MPSHRINPAPPSPYMKRTLSLLLLAAAATFPALLLPAQAPAPPPAAAPAAEERELRAEQSSYDNKTGELTLRGKVLIREKGQTLTCDEARYNNQTKDAVATGNVVLVRENGEIWRGDTLKYNFATGDANLGLVRAYIAPFHLDAIKMQRFNEGHYRLEDVTITTCDPANPEFYVHAGSAEVFDERVIRVNNAVSWLRGVPILWLPAYTLDPEREQTHFDFLPGYSSSHGAYALTRYTFPVDEELSAFLRLDYRAKRGVAGGGGLNWWDAESNYFRGGLQAYVLEDQKPYRSAAQEERLRQQLVEIEPSRYRLKLNHYASLTDHDTLYANAEYLSDARVVRDFFDDDYRLNPEPDTRLSYSHNGDGFSAGLELNRQLNEDEFDGVNRLPEAFVNVLRGRIGDTDLYYEGRHSAGFYERNYGLFSEQSGREDYDTQRIHSSNRVYYPRRAFGFLNLIPRAGYTGTFYGDTYESREISRVTQNVATNGVVTFTTNRTQEIRALGADVRHLPELGFETSFKAFKVFDDGPTTLGRGLRHVAEPYANITYIPEPDLRPANIYRFDSVDALDRRNDLVLGVRNKIQTKVIEEQEDSGKIWDYADANVFARFDYDPEPEEDAFAALGYDLRLRPARRVALRTRGEHDPAAGELVYADTRATVGFEDRSSLSLSHLYRSTGISALVLGYTLWPKAPFSLEGFSRYEFEEGIFEEQSLFITRQTRCVGYGLGVKWIAGDGTTAGQAQDEDDWQVWCTLWLTAKPSSRLQLGR